MIQSEKEWYLPPPDFVFEETKAAAIKLWKTFDDTYGYATEKVNAIKDLENVGDNWHYILGLFDIHNLHRLINSLPKLGVTQNMVIHGHVKPSQAAFDFITSKI